MNEDKAKAAVPLTLGGQTRLLMFDFHALCVIQQERGPKFLENLSSSASFADLAFLTWAELLRFSPELDAPGEAERYAAQKKVEDWLEVVDDIDAVGQAVGKAYANFQAPKGAGRRASKNVEGAASPTELIGSNS